MLRICLHLASVYFSDPISTVFFCFVFVSLLSLVFLKLNSSLVLYCTLFSKVPAGVDTLIPLSLQGKDNSLLQQLLPTLLNSAVLGELVPPCVTFLYKG